MKTKQYRTAKIRARAWSSIEKWQVGFWDSDTGEEEKQADRCVALLVKNNQGEGLTKEEWKEFKTLENEFYIAECDYIACTS